MRKTILLFLLLAGAGAIAWWQLAHSQEDPSQLVLHGNVDIRQVSLAFTLSERLLRVAAEEGDRVERGQPLAQLDTQALELQRRRAVAAIHVAEQQLARLRAGSRPEEIAQARAQVDAARAEVALAASQQARLQDVARRTEGRGVSAQELDAAHSRLRAARAGLEVHEQALQLALAGPRRETIAAAEAELEAAQAALAQLEHQIAQATLYAPQNGVIRARLLEPGDIASPQRPVFTLALTEPKWVRVYVDEPDLGLVQPGMAASVMTDSFPQQPLAGRIGYIASVAEFTPKTVQTDTLRTALVYEVRVIVEDADNRLRLGMPATVRIATDTVDGGR
jgi:HlyD family secretion protein